MSLSYSLILKKFSPDNKRGKLSKENLLFEIFLFLLNPSSQTSTAQTHFSSTRPLWQISKSVRSINSNGN